MRAVGAYGLGLRDDLGPIGPEDKSGRAQQRSDLQKIRLDLSVDGKRVWVYFLVNPGVVSVRDIVLKPTRHLRLNVCKQVHLPAHLPIHAQTSASTCTSTNICA